MEFPRPCRRAVLLLSVAVLAIQLAATTVSAQKARLAGGASQSVGRLEIERNGVWGLVCVDNVDDATTLVGRVVCRELGLKSLGSIVNIPTSDSLYPTSAHSVMMSDPACTGWEANLASCYTVHPMGLHTKHTCSRTGALEVNCGGEYLTFSLVNGSAPYIGRVQVSSVVFDHIVCGEFFYMNDANVVCRQLGFGPALRVFPPNHFGPGTDNAIYKHPLCSGTERQLQDCFRGVDKVDIYCSSNKAAAIECAPPASVAAPTSAVPTRAAPTSAAAAGSPGTTVNVSGADSENGTAAPACSGTAGGSNVGSGNAAGTSWAKDSRSAALITLVVLLSVVLAVTVVLLCIFRMKYLAFKPREKA